MANNNNSESDHELNAQENSPTLSNETAYAISDMMGLGDLLVQKTLTKTDIERIVIPNKEIEKEGLLNDEEKQHLERNKELQLDLFDPSSNRTTVTLKKYQSFELTKGWTSVLERNNLVEGDKVQLWSFRPGQKLRLLLLRGTVASKEEP